MDHRRCVRILDCNSLRKVHWHGWEDVGDWRFQQIGSSKHVPNDTASCRKKIQELKSLCRKRCEVEDRIVETFQQLVSHDKDFCASKISIQALQL